MSSYIASREAAEFKPSVSSAGPRVEVSAFQINDSAIATIKLGDEVLTSGIFPVKTLADGKLQLCIDGDHLDVTVEYIDDDPKKVGEAYYCSTFLRAFQWQTRFYWRGHAFLDPEDGAGAAQELTPEAT